MRIGHGNNPPSVKLEYYYSRMKIRLQHRIDFIIFLDDFLLKLKFVLYLKEKINRLKYRILKIHILEKIK